MKLVLLPGLDGTGHLFAPFLLQLNNRNTQIISLPDSGPQDYPSLCQWLQGRLPDEPCILLGESFSGPLAIMLAANNSNIKGLVLVATFLNPVRSMLRRLCCWLPLRLMLRSRCLVTLLAKYLLGAAGRENLPLLVRVLLGLNSGLVRSRLAGIDSLLHIQWPKIFCPCIYLQARRDSLVPASSVLKFKSHCDKFEVVTLPSDHFVLQSQASLSAAAVAQFVEQVQAQT